jgi:polyhydroxybutyrate depolymerase
VVKPKQQPGRIVPRAVYAVGSRLLLGLLACAVVALVVLVSPVTIARTQEQRLVVGGRDRVYLLHLPPQYGGEARLPLVIMLHPRGDYARQFEVYSGMSAKADREGFVVAYPNGSGDQADPALSWNAGFCCGYPLEHNLDDVGFVEKLLDGLLAGYALDPRKVFVAGWSNGGMLAYRLAAELPGRITAIAVDAASIGGQTKPFIPYYTIPKPRTGLPVLTFHGRADPVVPYVGGLNEAGDSAFTSVEESVAFWVDTNGCRTPPAEEYLDIRGIVRSSYAQCREDAAVVSYMVPDGGHVYFGGLQELTRNLLSRNVYATDIIWDFSKDRQR